MMEVVSLSFFFVLYSIHGSETLKAISSRPLFFKRLRSGWVSSIEKFVNKYLDAGRAVRADLCSSNPHVSLPPLIFTTPWFQLCLDLAAKNASFSI
jgi:hypothetical protein